MYANLSEALKFRRNFEQPLSYGPFFNEPFKESSKDQSVTV